MTSSRTSTAPPSANSYVINHRSIIFAFDPSSPPDRSPLLQVQECYELAAEYEGKRDAAKLKELGSRLAALAPADAILVAGSIQHMLNLANLAEELQIANRRRNKLKSGDFSDEGSATTESNIDETIKRLVDLGKSKEEVFEALKNQSVDLVLTAHPTQSVRRSLLQKHARYVSLSSFSLRFRSALHN